MSNILKSQFTKSEIESIYKTEIKDRQHPLKRLLFPKNDKDLQVVANTERALKYILMKDKPWFEKMKKGRKGKPPKLLNTKHYSSSSSALGEIRAYGYLLESTTLVKSVPKKSSPTPDFVVKENSEEIWVEVYSKQLHGEESRDLAEFYNEMTKLKEGRKGIIGEHFVRPFGKPNRGENIAEKVISVLASIKESEKQASEENTSILWLDFQDEIWNLGIGVDSVLPVSSGNGKFFAGEFWYAFYGWEGAPIFERQTTEIRHEIPPIQMRGDGRFRQNTKFDTVIISLFDAVIISLPRNTIIFENPYSEKPVKSWLWEKLVHLPWFNFEYSYLNWPKENLKQRIKIQEEILKALSRKAIYSW